MGIVGDIATLVTQAYKVWQDQRGEQWVSGQALFEGYVDPSYRLLKEVHTDYLDLYIELEERIESEPKPSQQTVQWFARARSRRQADRSELRLLDIPVLEGSSERARDTNSTALEYLSSIRAYFLPVRERRQLSKDRLKGFGPTPATATEARLRALVYWSCLPEEDQRMLATEELLERQQREAEGGLFPADYLIERLVLAAGGEPVPGVSERLRVVDAEASAALAKASKSVQKRVELALRGQNTLQRNHIPFDKFSWREVICDHVRHQRRELEHAMSRVQRAYVRLRILTDAP